MSKAEGIFGVELEEEAEEAEEAEEDAEDDEGSNEGAVDDAGIVDVFCFLFLFPFL